MSLITSTSNPHIKQIRKLRDRKERQQSGLFYIEGLRIIAEAAQQKAAIEELVVSPQDLTSDFAQKLVEDLRNRGVPLLEVSAEVFESISLKEGPKGVAAVVRQNWVPLDEVEPAEGESWVALDEVADPGNLGTILRTHDAVGGQGIILLDHSTDPYDPTATRASMGALFSQKLVKATFEEFAAWKKRTGCALIGTSGSSDVDYHGVQYPERMVLLMGSERQGMQEHHFRLCDTVVRIPMAGCSDSLNLAMATGIVLYEIFNQRRSPLASKMNPVVPTPPTGKGFDDDSNHTGRSNRRWR